MSILFNNPLLGASGQGPSADLGDTIEQSLRFRGGISGSGNGGMLSKTITTSSTTAALTISFWVKLGSIPSGYSRFIFSSGTAGSASGNISYDMASDEASIRFQDTSSFTAFRTQKLRDFSAWYHIVYRFDAANQFVKVYVNGSEHSSTSIATSARTSYGATSPMQIGRYADSSYVNNYWDGYLAEWNMLFGTSLGPDSFGRTNDDGVWVPKSLSDLTSNQYGALGNRLVFDSSAGLGDDTAPTGGTHASANDFTASGFDTANIASYAGTIFTDHVNTGASATPNTSSTASTFTNAFTNAFDGSTSTRIYTSGAGSWIIFRPSSAIPMSTGLRIWAEGAYVNQVWLNGSNSSFTSTGTTTWQTIPIGSETQITNIAIQGTPSPAAGATLFAIEVDGTILVHNIENDVDYNDTPTSNYATLNPLSPSAGTLSEANLHATSSSVGSTPNVPATIRNVTSGDWYFEFDGSNGNTNFGIVPGDDVNYPLGDPRGNGTPAIWFGPNTVFSGISGVSAMSLSPSVTFTDFIMAMRVNIDNEEVTFYGEGTDQGTYTFAQLNTNLQVNLANQPLSFFATPILSNEKVNYGQRPFVYRPSGLTDTGNLQINNLPEPTIKKGNKHFGVLTYTVPASPSFPITINGSGGNNGTGELDFDGSPDMVWIKMTNGATEGVIIDSNRGAGQYLEPRSSGGKTDITNFAFATNGFTLSAQSEQLYQQNDSYVAWCWKAGGTATNIAVNSITASTPSIASSVSANTDAGFSIVSYTGNSTLGATIGHGLSSPPEWILVKNRDSSADWAVYHKYVDATAPEDKYMALNTNDGIADAVDRWNDTAPTSSVFSVGDAIQTNGSNDMIAYCWHSVEGFSKFGSYEGNGNVDGPFIYTGFRPAFVMIKNIDAAYEWMMYDTARNPNNPSTNFLTANETAAEQTNRVIDILSNGFKCRDNSNQLNKSSHTFVYMAFAENPFGGENAPPATAR